MINQWLTRGFRATLLLDQPTNHPWDKHPKKGNHQVLLRNPTLSLGYKNNIHIYIYTYIIIYICINWYILYHLIAPGTARYWIIWTCRRLRLPEGEDHSLPNIKSSRRNRGFGRGFTHIWDPLYGVIHGYPLSLLMASNSSMSWCFLECLLLRKD